MILHLDSEYVRKGSLNGYTAGKPRLDHGCQTAGEERRLAAAPGSLVANGGHSIEWKWVKGHAGDPGNERADALANQGVPNGRV